MFSALLQHQWKRVTRRMKSHQGWVKVLVMLVIGGYFTFILVTLGQLAGDIIRYTMAGRRPVPFVNSHLLPAFIGLFSFRFFLQRSPDIGIQAYLHLPVSRPRLVRFYQLFSLVSVHNIFPLLFLVPFWVRYLPGEGFGVRSSVVWLTGIMLTILISHFANTALRALLSRNLQAFLLLVAIPAGLLVIDALVLGGLISQLSYFIYNELSSGNGLMLLGFVLILLGVYQVSSVLLAQRLRDVVSMDERRSASGRTLAFVPERGALINLMILELKMMWRNKRPKQFVVVSLAFSMGYLGLLLTDEVQSGTLLAAIVGMFSSGFFALNYGQLMFGWESRQFDGHLSRSLKPRQFILSKLVLLQASCLVLFAITMPLFVWLAPHLLPINLAFFLYNIGITSVLMLSLAVRNRHRINVSNSSFLNYEGFSLWHWLWFIPTILPPSIIMALMQDRPDVALICIGGLGLASAVLTPLWGAFFTQQFLRQRYDMAAGFRYHAY